MPSPGAEHSSVNRCQANTGSLQSNLIVEFFTCIISQLKNIIVCMCGISLGGRVHVPRHMCGGQRTAVELGLFLYLDMSFGDQTSGF